DGPTRTVNSLSRIVRLTSLTACTSSYFLLSSLSTTCAMSDLCVTQLVCARLECSHRSGTMLALSAFWIIVHGAQGLRLRACDVAAPVAATRPRPIAPVMLDAKHLEGEKLTRCPTSCLNCPD